MNMRSPVDAMMTIADRESQSARCNKFELSTSSLLEVQDAILIEKGPLKRRGWKEVCGHSLTSLLEVQKVRL